MYVAEAVDNMQRKSRFTVAEDESKMFLLYKNQTMCFYILFIIFINEVRYIYLYRLLLVIF